MLPRIKSPKKTIYLDYAATTPLHPLVKKAMDPFWHNKFGNPSSLYKQGREAALAIESARAKIAQLINARTNEIIFTAGGTESINLAIFGLTRTLSKKQKAKAHFITTTVEHHAVLRCFQALEREGFSVSYINVDSQGFINLDKLKKALRPETVLVSVMYANNEIGTIEPIQEIGKYLTHINRERIRQGQSRIAFHTDACQAAGFLDINVQHLGVDLMSVNASKIYGPKQSGFLYVKTGTKIEPIIFGGGQESGLRSGTENVAGIVGLAKALALVMKDQKKENARLVKLRDYFINQLSKNVSGVVLNGPFDRKGSLAHLIRQPVDRRLPNNINICLQLIDGEAILIYLDSYGIAVSTGSACSSTHADPSHVLLAIGRTTEQAQSTIRFTLGKATKKKELDYVIRIFPPIVKELRKVN